MRACRIDEAVIVERLRVTHSDIQDCLNELIGSLTAFSGYLENQPLL